jgi:hypothetical protein
MHYLIYIPGAKQQSRDLLATVGLSALAPLGTPEPHFAPLGEVGAGPDGGHGMLVLPWFNRDGNATNPPLAFTPDKQRWVAHPTANYWLGYWKEQPPTPADLARSNPVPYPGTPRKLEDGQTWILPNTFAQEATIALGSDGKPEQRSRYKHEDLYALGVPMLDMLRRQMAFEAAERHGDLAVDEVEPWDWAKGYQFLCYCLGLNYRVNDFIIGELGLLLHSRLFEHLAFATDLMAILKLQNELAAGN